MPTKSSSSRRSADRRAPPRAACAALQAPTCRSTRDPTRPGARPRPRSQRAGTADAPPVPTVTRRCRGAATRPPRPTDFGLAFDRRRSRTTPACAPTPADCRGRTPWPLDFDLADLGSLPFGIEPPAASTARRARRAALTTDPARSASTTASADACRPRRPGAGPADAYDRKIELAEEFRQIGDAEGARELLLEVIAKRHRRAEGEGAGHAGRAVLSAAQRGETAPVGLSGLSEPASPPGRGARIALGVGYRGTAYHGWQCQPGGPHGAGRLEGRWRAFAGASPSRTVCAGRTDAGVHAPQPGRAPRHRAVERAPFSWVRGTNRYLPRDIAVQWCQPVRRRLPRAQQRARPALPLTCCSNRRCGRRSKPGWSAGSFRPLDGDAMRAAAGVLVGEHDFSAFRSAECQAPTPVKTLRAIGIARPRRLLALRLRRQRLPAPHGAQHHGLPGRRRQRPARRRLAGRGARRARPRRSPRPPFRRRACTSSARTTMRATPSPSTRRPATGCPERRAARPAHDAPHPHQDLRPHPRGRCRRRRRRRRRRARLRAVRREPAPRDAGARRGARRAGCRLSSRRCCCSSTPRPPKCAGAGRHAPRAAAVPRRRDAGATATRRPALTCAPRAWRPASIC